jgi:NAD-dependent DNA ligase
VFTGFRDKELAAQLEKLGMEQGSGVSANTFVVIARDPEDETGKVGQAKKLGVPIMTLEQFRGKYQI